MAGKGTLTVRIIGDERDLSGALKRASRQVSDFGTHIGGVARSIGVGILGAATAGGAAVVEFGRESVQAAKRAEESELQLHEAFRKFPKLATTNIQALEKLNAALALKTRFDHNEIASSEAVIARFNLTGQQVKQITPLILDYAAATGIAAPEAADKIGKALLGNARALKAIGINFKATGHTAKDFATIVGLLQSKIGGFATQQGKTAAGALAILGHQFELVKEKVGAGLLPVLAKLAVFAVHNIGPVFAKIFAKLSPALDTAIKDAKRGIGIIGDVLTGGDIDFQNKSPFVQFAIKVGEVIKNDLIPAAESVGHILKEIVLPAVVDAAKVGFGAMLAIAPAVKAFFGFIAEHATAFKALAAAVIAGVVAWKAYTVVAKTVAAVQALINVVMDANPIALIVVGVAALAAGLVVLYKHSKTFRDIVADVFGFLKTVAVVVIDTVVAEFHGLMDVIGVLIGAFKAVQRVVSDLVAFWKDVWVGGIKLVARVFLDLVGVLVDGAARAFGWIPGLGPKLKAAARKFDEFRDEANAALNGIKDQTVTVYINQRVTGGGVVGSHPAAAEGGYIKGPRNKPVTYTMHGGEYVWTTAMVSKAGPQVMAALERFRAHPFGTDISSLLGGFAKPVAARQLVPFVASGGGAVRQGDVVSQNIVINHAPPTTEQSLAVALRRAMLMRGHS